MKVSNSPWLLHYDGSSCNGCDIEVLACLTPVYDAERFGVINTGNPKHADIFLITGGINEQNKPVVQQLYSQMPSPKVVVAVATWPLRITKGSLASLPRMEAKAKPAPNSRPLQAGTANIR